MGHALNVAPGSFVARAHSGVFSVADEVEATRSDSSRVILDARSAGRFHGREAEPRAGLRPGHIPGSKNLPFGQVVANGQMRTPSELRKILAPLARPDQGIVTSCGSGVTACIIALAAELAGYRPISVYDGSWAEWGASNRPVEQE